MSPGRSGRCWEESRAYNPRALSGNHPIGAPKPTEVMKGRTLKMDRQMQAVLCPQSHLECLLLSYKGEVLMHFEPMYDTK